MQRAPRHRLPEVADAKVVAAARNGLPQAEVLAEAVEVFKILASPVRIGIMHALAHHEMSVGDLARALDLSLSVASHQLALLRRMKLVAARAEGRLTFYRATSGPVDRLIHACLTHVGELLTPSEAHRHPHRGGSRRRP